MLASRRALGRRRLDPDGRYAMGIKGTSWWVFRGDTGAAWYGHEGRQVVGCAVRPERCAPVCARFWVGFGGGVGAGDEDLVSGFCGMWERVKIYFGNRRVPDGGGPGCAHIRDRWTNEEIRSRA